MKLFEIKSYFSGRVLFALETESLKLCVEAAVKSDAVLSGAVLRGAVLRGAVLRGADLRDADLSGAVLRGADLRDADLRGADLRGADLRGAVLRDAVLRDAVLRGADLRDAVLRGADLSGAVLRDAVLRGADLSGAVLRDAVLDVPVATDEQAIENLDRVREIILDDTKRLRMDHWHEGRDWQKRTCAEEAVCGTTHCLAGWLQVCSTDEKIRKLEPNVAGVVLAPVAAKMFYRSEDEVLDWLRDRKYAVVSQKAAGSPD